MKTVAIIGAGPSGIVSAKVLTHTTPGAFKVRIFEKSSEVGGLWAVHKERPYDGMLDPDMPTNLSRFNIGFSDLAWSSVGISGHIPYWPRAWQAGTYLREYVRRWLPHDSISYNTTIENCSTEIVEGIRRFRLKWKRDEDKSIQQGLFDHVIVASGFFGATSMSSMTDSADAVIKTVHSTKLRRLADVAPDDPTASGTILVVGGGMSGADSTTVLANQLSDALHCPTSDGTRYINLKLVQLCPEPAYALPLAAPADRSHPKAPTFLPLDICMYDLGQRPPGDIILQARQMPRATIEAVHNAFQNIVGDQSELGVDNLVYREKTRATYATLTERYSAFVRNGDVEIVTGRLTQKSSINGSNVVQVTIEDKGVTTTIDDVVGIVYATGFSPQPSLSFLSTQLQNELHYDPNHVRLPILLDEYATLSSNCPGLAVVGFHEGAFWGSMEMEARLVEQRWREGNSNSNSGHASQQIRELQTLREAMTNKETDVPQYWLGDYVGLMESITREVPAITRNDLDFSIPRSGPICGARYTLPTDDQDEANKTLEGYSDILHKSKTEAMFVARAAFLALQGTWTIKRTITSFLTSMPSGTLDGQASFFARNPTDTLYDFEHLYVESGTFSTTSGLAFSMQARKSYVYRYQEATDSLTVWFTKPANDKAVDYFFHDLVFDVKDRENEWKARASHLCVRDMYETSYRFVFRGSWVVEFVVVHVVKGPLKDYVSETRYSRPLRKKVS